MKIHYGLWGESCRDKKDGSRSQTGGLCGLLLFRAGVTKRSIVIGGVLGLLLTSPCTATRYVHSSRW